MSCIFWVVTETIVFFNSPYLDKGNFNLYLLYSSKNYKIIRILERIALFLFEGE